MSYCRADGISSDVYLMSTGNEWWCAGCDLSSKKGFIGATRQETLLHLEEHRKAGDRVPERAFERLRKEIREAKKS